MNKYSKGIGIAHKLFSKVIGLSAHSIYQGSCSFINIYWGEKRIQEQKTRMHGIIYLPGGDWWLSIYMCSWEIFKNKISISYSESSREEIASALVQIEGKKLTAVKIQNKKFDMLLEFDLGDKQTIHIQIWADAKKENNEAWKFFTLDNKCFTAGPGNFYRYEPNEWKIDI